MKFTAELSVPRRVHATFAFSRSRLDWKCVMKRAANCNLRKTLTANCDYWNVQTFVSKLPPKWVKYWRAVGSSPRQCDIPIYMFIFRFENMGFVTEANRDLRNTLTTIWKHISATEMYRHSCRNLPPKWVKFTADYCRIWKWTWKCKCRIAASTNWQLNGKFHPLGRQFLDKCLYT